jgi:outer membrane protein assembly factor BamB
MDRHFYALRLSDGQMIWDSHTQGAFAGTPVLRNDTLYIGAFDDKLYALDARTGDERWRFPGENWFWGGPVIYGDILYAVDVNGNVYALDAETGDQVWHQPLDAPVRAGPVLSVDGSQVFVGSQNGTLYALDTGDGFVLWSRADEGNGQFLSPPVVSESTVYTALIYGSYRIQAWHVDNGRDVWSYPQTVEN